MAHGRFADWVGSAGGCGRRTGKWSWYLREVAERAEAEIVSGELVGLDVERRQVAARTRGKWGDLADGVVFTGSGPPITVAGQPREHPRVFDGRSHWLQQRALKKQIAESVCVIGSGRDGGVDRDQPAEEVPQTLDCGRPDEPRGSYSRGESYDENRFYSDPGDWPRLAESHRREFLERTDRGVFSMQAEAILNHSRGFRMPGAPRSRPAIHRSSSRSSTTTSVSDVAYDLVVVAIGVPCSLVRVAARR